MSCKTRKYKCPVCGKTVAGYIPRGGDGSLDLLWPHKNKKGERCPWSKQEAEQKAE